MKRKTIRKLGDEVVEELKKLNFAHYTVIHYQQIFNRFASYAEAHGSKFWEERLMNDFLLETFGFDPESGDKPGQYTAQCWRGCYMLGFFEETGNIPGKRATTTKTPPIRFRCYIELMVADDIERGLSEETIRGRQSDVIDFLDYLDSNDVASLEDIDAMVIDSFLSERHDVAPGAMQRTLSSTRCFLRCMFSYGIIECDLSVFVPHASRYPVKRMTKLWSTDEIERLLGSIPRTDAPGKRDFAILALITSYGMRCGDVIRLRLCDIEWETNTINIVQHKTGKQNALPMSDGIGWALADWIANGRPKQATCPEVFTKLTAPYNALANVGTILKRRMSSAGIKKIAGTSSGPHSLRHSVATGMLSQGTKVPVIASVLGNTVETATKVYLHADIEGLRECALGKGL